MTSWWQADAGPSPRTESALRDCDVAVIGGGFAGLSVARVLASRTPGLSVDLFEADAVGAGASGRNGGWFLPGLAAPGWLVDPRPERRWALGRLVDLLEETATELAEQGAPVERARAVIGVGFPLATAGLVPLAARLRGLGVHPVVLRHGDHPALELDAWQVQPLALARWLADAARQFGAQVHEHTPARLAGGGADGLHLDTPRGRVRAQRVVVCTNAYAGWSPHRVMHSYVLATAPLPADQVERLGGEARLVGHLGVRGLSFRRVHRGRLVYGGLDVPGLPPTEASASDPAALARLRRWLAHELPWLDAPVEFTWGGPFVRNGAELPVLGPSPVDERVVLNTGYGGSGVALGCASGRLAAGLVTPGLDDDVSRLRAHLPRPRRHSPSPHPRAGEPRAQEWRW